MRILNMKDFYRGWFIGDFEPSVLRTPAFEAGVLFHSAGEQWAAHFHKEADEYNILIDGAMKVNGVVIHAGQLFHIEKGEIAIPEFTTDCVILVIKVPSVIGDKYEVNLGENGYVV